MDLPTRLGINAIKDFNLPGDGRKDMKMFENILNQSSKLVKTCLTKANGVIAATAATLAIAGAAEASTTTSTTVVTPSFGVPDVLNTILNQVYPAIIPILTGGAVVFGAWWIWHKIRGAVS